MELIDLYNEAGEKLDIKIPRGTELPPDTCFMVVHLCVFNSKGELLIQRRSANKKLYGNLWDFSAGGFVLAGENAEEATIREAKEELGLDASYGIEFALRARIPKVIDDFYMLHGDLDIEDLTAQPEEVSELAWVGLDELLEMLETGEFVPYERELIVDLFKIGLE